jgi:hypothetical protein
LEAEKPKIKVSVKDPLLMDSAFPHVTRIPFIRPLIPLFEGYTLMM